RRVPNRRHGADNGVGGLNREQKEPKTNHPTNQHTPLPTPRMIGKVPKHPPADRAHNKTNRKKNSGIQLLNNWIITGEERVGEIECKGGVRIKIVPLDKIPYRPDEDCL